MTIKLSLNGIVEYAFHIEKVGKNLFRAICAEVNLVGSGIDQGEAVEALRKEIEWHVKETTPLKPNVIQLQWKEHEGHGVITVREEFR